MHDRGFWQLDHVEDGALERELAELLSSGARNEARILAHLAEVEERRLHLLAAFPSMYAYCLRRLGLSEDEACRRITCARLAWRFPVIFTLVESRGLHLSGLYLLRRHLTEGNHAELLQAACGKTKKQVEEVVAIRFPLPDVPSTIRKLPDIQPFSRIEQRSAETFRIQINASKAFKEKLELACDLVSHSVPNRDLAQVLERGLDLLIAKVERERFGKLTRPAKRPVEPGSGPPGPEGVQHAGQPAADVTCSSAGNSGNQAA
jgi:hypothetical protein